MLSAGPGVRSVSTPPGDRLGQRDGAAAMTCSTTSCRSCQTRSASTSTTPYGTWRGWTALRDVPPDAVWPRLMTVPHPRAVDSLGPEFEWWVRTRTGRRLRWWQRLVACAAARGRRPSGRLVWETLLLSMARQLGKSWLLRELLMWRLHQGDRFGEPQVVVHTGKDAGRLPGGAAPGAVWAKRAAASLYGVREVNGQEEIERLERRVALDAGLEGRPSTASRRRWRWSTKRGRCRPPSSMRASSRRWWSASPVTAAAGLDGAPDGDVADARPADGGARAAGRAGRPGPADRVVGAPVGRARRPCRRGGWRRRTGPSSRERMIAKQLARRCRRCASDDPDEPDPIESLRAQWLNQWPAKLTVAGAGEELVDRTGGGWPRRARRTRSPVRLWVAVEDDYGRRRGGRRLRGRARRRPARGRRLAVPRPGQRPRRGRRLVDARSVVGDADRRPVVQPRRRDVERAGAAETRFGLPLLRTLVAAGRLVHDDTPELDEQLATVRVRAVSRRSGAGRRATRRSGAGGRVGGAGRPSSGTRHRPSTSRAGRLL